MPVDPSFSLVPYDGHTTFKRVRIRHNRLIQAILARIRLSLIHISEPTRPY